MICPVDDEPCSGWHNQECYEDCLEILELDRKHRERHEAKWTIPTGVQIAFGEYVLICKFPQHRHDGLCYERKASDGRRSANDGSDRA